MNTKSNKMKINPAYESLFSFGSKKEKIEHKAQMISFRILSEVEKICDEKKINKRVLSKLVGTSPSYITQLFRGTKQVNTEIMAKFEEALNISFQIDANPNETMLTNNIDTEFYHRKQEQVNGPVMYYFHGGQKDKTGEIVNRLETENKLLQIA